MMHRAWSLYGLLVAASVVYCACLFTGLDQWGRGDWDQFSFRYETPRRALLDHGQLPLWNPYVNGGNVLLAHPHCPALSPWYLPTLLLGAPLGLRVSVVLFVALGSTGMAALLRRWEVSPAGCFTGGVLLMMSTHFAMHVTEGHLEWCVLGLMPWVLWCLVRAEHDWRFTILGGLLFASGLLYGSVYIVVVFVPMFALWAVLEGIRTASWRITASCAVMIGLTFLLCAVVLLPRIEFLRANPRRTRPGEQVSPASLGRMLLDPRQADIFRQTRDVRNPPDAGLDRLLPARSSSSTTSYNTLRWHRLEVTIRTTSDWTEVHFRNFDYRLFPGGLGEEEKTPAQLNALPRTNECLAIHNPSLEKSKQTIRATLYVRLPDQGDLEFLVTRGNMGRTWLTVKRGEGFLLDARHSILQPGDLKNARKFAIPSHEIVGRPVPDEERPAGPWYRVEATLQTTAAWCDVQEVNSPYVFEVTGWKNRGQTQIRPSMSVLATGSRSPGKDWAEIDATLYFQRPKEGSLRVALLQGREGTSKLALRTADGRPLAAQRNEIAGRGGEKTVEYRVAKEVLDDQLRPLPEPPLRWRLNQLGMRRDWHEYGCYLTWVGLAMALLGLIVAFGRLWPLIATGLLAGLIVLGSALPLNLWVLWKQLPMYGSLQVPSRFLVAVVFVLAVGGGYGVDRLGRWTERIGGPWVRRLLVGGVVLSIYVELVLLGWNLFSDVFVCKPGKKVPHYREFAQRFADDDAIRDPRMYSAHYPYLLGNSGVIRGYENVAVKPGKVRITSDPDYRGEAYLENSQGTAKITDWSMSRVRVGLDVKAPDRLVLNQNYFQGWKVIRRDAQRKAEKLPAHASPKGLVSIEVRPGDREIEFYYLPDSFLWGAIVSGLTLLSCLGLLVVGSRGSWKSWKSSRMIAAVSRRCGLARRSPAAMYLTAAVVLNLPFLLCHPGRPLVDTPLVRSLAINVVLFLAPGLPLVGLMIGRGWLLRLHLICVIVVSFAVFATVLTVAHIAGLPLEGSTIWNGTWMLMNLAILLNVVLRGPPAWGVRLSGKAAWIGLLMFAVAYLAYFHGATDVVPVMDDHDYETQGTAHSLATTLQMQLLTDRGTDFCYAHPPLVHAYVAGSFLYYGQMDDLTFYDEAWNRVQLAEHEGSISGERVSARELEVERLYDRFRRNSHHLLPTRTPNVFLAALTVGLLGWWIVRMTGRGWLGLLVPLAYATSPEVFVRSGYGGYFAISNFALVQILLATEHREEDRSWTAWIACLLAGMFAGLANHKLVLLPVALVVWELMRLGRGWTAKRVAGAVLHPVLIGFAAGTLSFWAYGLGVSPDVFWLEHIRYHLADRIAHLNPLGYGGYPTVWELWWEFIGHTGYVLLPLGVLALVSLCRAKNVRENGPGDVPEDGSEAGRITRGWRNVPGLWAVWALLIAVAFSLIDWRQTKHLMPLLLPLHLAAARWGALGRAGLVLIGVLFAGLLLWNVAMLRILAADFPMTPDHPYFPITPAW
jgi:hypothetical protein